MNRIFLVALMSITFLSACASTPKPPETVSAPVTEAQTPQPADTSAAQTNPLTDFAPGTKLPLVCNKPYTADGKLVDRPNMQVMWENYLKYEPQAVFNYIGGKVAVNGNLPADQGQWTNACTVRLSHMMNVAGHKLKHDGRKTVSGWTGDKYYYRVADLEKYLAKTFGPPDVSVLDGTGNAFDLPESPGIVLMDYPDSSFTGHVTVWNGSYTVDETNIGGYRVLFWDLPCFLPADRVPQSIAMTGAHTPERLP